MVLVLFVFVDCLGLGFGCTVAGHSGYNVDRVVGAGVLWDDKGECGVANDVAVFCLANDNV